MRIYQPAPLDEVATNPPTPPRAITTLGKHALLGEAPQEGWLWAEWDGRRFRCPLHPQLRMLESLVMFRHMFPGPTADLLVPENFADRATSELEAMRQRDPELRSHILVSAWHVPLRWFAAFDPSERETVEQPQGLSIRYRSGLAPAVRRTRHVAKVLEEAGFHHRVIDPVVELSRWMASFSPKGMIELDYAGVASLFSSAELALDETAVDLQSSLTALEEGDLDAAGSHYERAAMRWADAQALAYLN